MGPTYPGYWTCFWFIFIISKFKSSFILYIRQHKQIHIRLARTSAKRLVRARRRTSKHTPLTLGHECRWRWLQIRTFLYIRCTMPTLLVLATVGVLPVDFLLLFCFGGVAFDLRALFGLRFGAVRAFLAGGGVSIWKIKLIALIMYHY